MNNYPKNNSRKALVSFFLLSTALLSACAANEPIVEAEPTATETIVATEASSGAITAPINASCTAVSSQDREDALLNSPFAAISAGDWVRGGDEPAVSIIEYGDFQCPFCGALAPILAELEARYPDDLQVAFRHFPLIGSVEQPIHEKAKLAAAASEAAGKQGFFWEFHDFLFVTQSEWTNLSEGEFIEFLVDGASDLGLDTAVFEADMLGDELQTLAEQAWIEGREIGISGTPFLIVNGFPYQGPSDIFSLDAIIKMEMLRERHFNECPEFTIDMDAEYTATIQTEKGDVVISLLPQIAPVAVNSFVFLAENDWFDNVTFHRVIPGFMAQGGDPTGTGFGGPGYTFEIETNSNYLFDREGLLAMANSGPTSNGSQFFITFGEASHLNGGFTIFGEVLQGMDVVRSLTARNPAEDPTLAPGDLILDVIIEVN
jgi:cyclophilin family peptidyl-prolyl cis-trans isomerase/protein-disulfide isomerase